MKQYKVQITASDGTWEVPYLVNAESEDEAISIVIIDYDVSLDSISAWEV